MAVYFNTAEEHDEYTQKVIKMSIWAILIPLAVTITGQVFGYDLFLTFSSTMLAMFVLNRWTYDGLKEDNMFIPLAIVSFVIVLMMSLGSYIVEKRDTRLMENHHVRIHS